MQSYTQPPANEYPCRDGSVTGLEHDGFMFNKDGDMLENSPESDFFCTLWCNRNNQKCLIHTFFVHLREITLHTFLKNLAWHISGLKLCYAQVLEGQYRSSSLLLYSVNEWRVIECSTPRHLYKAEVLQCEGQREGERETEYERALEA